MTIRVASGTICHETSTFTPVATTWDNYRQRYGYLHGEEIHAKFAGTNTPIGGFIEGAQAHGFELIHTVYGEPHPSGPTPRDIFDTVLGELLDGIRTAGAIDGVLLQLHGSMVAQGIDDAEGHILAAVRDVVGSQVPVLAQLDIHSNVSQQMVDMADVLIGRETYPEVDMAPRGRECADVLVRIHRQGLRPTMALRKIPMMWGMIQVTIHSPMSEAIAKLHEIESRPGVVCGSIATCYPLSDVPDMGASVYIVTDNDQDLAQRYADELGEWLYARKEEWHESTLTTREAMDLAEREGKFPMVFADKNDNTGGGSPGDSTGMLRTFKDARLRDACVLYIVDPEAVEQCRNAGVGTTLTLMVGAKSTPMQGDPVEMTPRVVALGDGRFRYHGPMYEGLEGDMGPSAHICEDGLHVLLVSQREQPLDTAFSESLELDPRRMRYLGVKSSAHFRAGFESWAGAIHLVTEPSVHDLRPGQLKYHRLGRKLYPISPAD